jgi:hypothetical protein
MVIHPRVIRCFRRGLSIRAKIRLACAMRDFVQAQQIPPALHLHFAVKVCSLVSVKLQLALPLIVLAHEPGAAAVTGGDFVLKVLDCLSLHDCQTGQTYSNSVASSEQKLRRPLHR